VLNVHTNEEMVQALWLFSGSAILVLLRSIVDGTRRVWYRLLTGVVLGGLGGAMAGLAFADSKFVYAICGVAAIMTENIVLGLFKASQQFSDDPISVFSRIWRLVMPTFGKSAGTDDTPPKTEPAAG
jgi:hypothetical protein